MIAMIMNEMVEHYQWLLMVIECYQWLWMNIE